MILVLTIIVSGIGAYFTGTDRADDSYTIGKIEIALNGSDDLNKVEDLVPWDEYSFVRNVENTGINDAFVFMSVTVPYDAANLHDADGNTIYEDEDIQLFRYGTDGNAGVASQWKLVDAGKFADLDIQDMSATGIIEVSDTHGAVDTDDMSVTYVYGYVGDNADGSLKALAAGEITEDICDTMKFANVTDWNMEEKEGIILTRAYGIQTLNVLETNPLTGDNADGSVDVNAVWSVINNSRVGDGSISKNETFIPVTAVDQNGTDLDATSTLITGTERDELLDALDNQGLANSDEVDYLIDIKSDDFEDMADTTFDMSGIASEGDKVIILHYDETKGEWEYITEDTVDENLTVGGDFSSFSPVAIIIVPKEETETYTINLYTQNGDGTPFNDPVAINGPDGWSFEGDGATDDDGYQYIFGEGPDGLGVTKVDAGFVVPAGDYTVIDPSTGKQATFTVDHDGDYVAVLRAVSAELVERKLIIKDQEGNRISKAYYEIGYGNGDAMGLTDENGEAIVELPNEQYFSICIYTSDEHGGPDEYIFFGSIEKLTEETPYEITLPDDMDSVDWF